MFYRRLRVHGRGGRGEHNTDLGKRLLDDPAYADLVKTWMLQYVHRRATERHERLELDLYGSSR